MTIRWITAFIDRPAGPFEDAVQFWMEATGSRLSQPRGEFGEFATLLPPGGDAYLRVQRVQGGGGCHVDLHVDDVDDLASRATAAGAR
ncbi:MAG TPA: VOC family protein, partial [Acidimicrobiales bacterium]|nr:VOC family protein [Acidimicrobiales bacterium]